METHTNALRKGLPFRKIDERVMWETFPDGETYQKSIRWQTMRCPPWFTHDGCQQNLVCSTKVVSIVQRGPQEMVPNDARRGPRTEPLDPLLALPLLGSVSCPLPLCISRLPTGSDQREVGKGD